MAIPPRRTRRAYAFARFLLAATLPCSIVPPAHGQLDELRRVVDSACQCAAAQPSGMDAAVRCTEGPRAFGRVKVAAQDVWSDAERGEVAVLERIIETCIANALDRPTARQRLGLAPRPGPPGAAPLTWVQIRVEDLGDHAAKLARIHVDGAKPVKGLVETIDPDAIVIRRSRSDGGGTARIPVASIREAWVMQLP